MIILGAKPVQHDACFALVRDGEPLFIYEQERFNRIKHGMSSDLTVLFDALEEFSISPKEIDLVTTCIDPSRLPARKEQVRSFLAGSAADDMERYLDWRLPTWHRSMLAAGFPADRVVNIRHHLCHCAGVYYASPFDDAAILSVDGSGETETMMLAHGHGNDIKILRTTPHPYSLGHLYQAATFWLGWGFGEEGKTMALAGYGDPARYRAQLAEVVHVYDCGQFGFASLQPRGSNAYTPADLRTSIFARLFGAARADGEPLTQVHKDVAAAVQEICDMIMLRSAQALKAATNAKNLLITGGVALNSVSNGLIMRSGLYDQLMVYPQANDSGTALGGALYGYHQLGRTEQRRCWQMTHPYLGKAIDIENIEKTAAKYGQHGVRTDDFVEAVADLLAEGRIVGWAQGRSEIGPRSLGNRSILGNPLVDGIKQRINDDVKHRENWRPFAPSVLREDLSEYFEAGQDMPYMTVVAPIKEEWRERLASVGHIDGTARVQTVTAESNPRFYALLTAFKRRTGVGVLLNTSFNDRGEPLIQTCDQALRLYASSAMGALCVEDWLFTEKRPATAPLKFAPYLDNFAKLPMGRLLLLEGTGPATDAMPEPMRSYLLSIRPDLQTGRAEPRVAEDLGTRFDGVVCYVGRSADHFIFDEQLYLSDLAQWSRTVMQVAGVPVYWIDDRGDVVPARDVLYVQHGKVKCLVPSSYERHWQ